MFTCGGIGICMSPELMGGIGGGGIEKLRPAGGGGSGRTPPII